MPDDELRMLKATILRESAATIREQVASGLEPASHLIRASLLETRALRVESGEPDHTTIPPEQIG